MNAQQRYYRSPKGQQKLRHQNEKRTNKTMYKKVIEQINCVAYLCNKLSKNYYDIKFVKGGKLKFLSNPHYEL